MNQQTLFSEQSAPITVIDPDWLPDDLRSELYENGSLRYSFRFLKAERKVYKKEKPIKTSEWAEKHRVVTMSALPGPWRNEVTPYLVGIMDAADYHSVRELVACKCPQSGVTEGVHNWVGKRIDRDPGPVMYVFPDQLTAKENSDDRIQPMIERSPRLAAYLTGRQDDKTSFKINLQHMPIYLSWASSTARLANKPVRYGIADEIDKEGYSSTSKETSALNLIDKRLTTYKRNNQSKFIKISTPTVETGNIWVELNSCEVIFVYFVKCPHCGKTQAMTFDRITWEGGSAADVDELIKKRLARYSCIGCDALWDDNDRDRAVLAGEWRSKGKGIELFTYLKSFNPIKIGFHLPSWVTRFVSMSEAAASFIRGLTNIEHLKDFFNAHKAEPYVPKKRQKKEDVIKMLKDDRPASIVPGGNVVAAMICAADTQDDGFWYEIRAFGWGLHGDSWQVRSGFVKTFEALNQVSYDDVYQDVDGNRYIVNLGVIDSGGHRTKDVYDFCLTNRGMWIPIKGERKMAQPFKYTNIEFWPGTNKAIPGGIQLLRVNVTYFKNALASLLDINPVDPGAYHMNSEMPDDWAKQMTTEYVDESGFWECPDGIPNHAWDVSVYGLAGFDVLGAKYWAPPDDQPVHVNTHEQKKRTKRERMRPW